MTPSPPRFHAVPGYRPPALVKGQRIPGTQYRFVRVLGVGGHGEVYEVEHTFLRARAVMKLLHGHLLDRQDLAHRMTREARTLATLRHPNIVEVTDGGTTDEEGPRPYFVMESLAGMTLRELLRRVEGGVGVQAALRIAAGLLDGLHHAHRAGVIHRDIKPDNVFLHRTSTDVTVPKLLDFGIAHLLLARRVTGRAFLGTPRYSAPEQIRGEAPSPLSDVYAVGLVLFELLTGEPPFAERLRLGDVVHAHLHGALPPPSTRNRHVPAELDALVALLCARDPRSRPPTAFAAALALREVRRQLEAREAGAIHAPDFATEPAPMNDALFLASEAEPRLVTEHEATQAEEPEVTDTTGPATPYATSAGDPVPDTIPLREMWPTAVAPATAIAPATATATTPAPAPRRFAPLLPVTLLALAVGFALPLGGARLLRASPHAPPARTAPTCVDAAEDGATCAQRATAKR